MGFKNKKVLLFLFIILIGLLGFFMFRKFFSSTRQTARDSFSFKRETLTAEAINGLKVTTEIAKTRPIAVMIENHPDSRPQSGLLEADIVYEALAEGGITRFLALFQSKEAREIGPVRSAREYSAQIADEWGALYAHVGGSNEVISKIKTGRYKNLSDANEYYNGEFFPRPKNKIAPHNIYTSVELLKKLMAAHKFSDVAHFDPWFFKDDEPATEQALASRINIDFSRRGYEVEYVYVSSTNSYLRFLGGDAHIDEVSKTQLTVKNVVVQLVQVTPVPNDPLLQVNIQLEGEGKAIVFRDGKAIEGRWKKEGSFRTRYYDEFNQEIKFNRGPIWVELVPSDKEQNLIWH